MVESKQSDTFPAPLSRQPLPSPQPSLLSQAFSRQSMFYQPSAQQSAVDHPFNTVDPSTNTTFSIEDILEEINSEFKDIRGDPIFIRKPAVAGLDAIRDAIRHNTKDLLDKLNSMKALALAEEKKTKAARKKIKEAILDGQNKALETRIKLLEDLWIEYGPPCKIVYGDRTADAAIE